MNEIKKVYLSGLGAVGSAYASRLYEMDQNCIKVVVDSDRLQRYTETGILINDKTYLFDYIEPQSDAPAADLIIIAVKQHHLEQSIKDIKRFVGKDTVILSLLNGISSEEIIGKEFGMDKMLYAFCVGIDAVRENMITRFSKIGKIVFGEKANSTYTPRVQAVKELFDKAGIPYAIPEDMIREQWWKFMLNVGINQTSAILRAPYGVFQSVKEARELMIMGSREVINIAAKMRINLTEDDIEAYLKIINTLSPDGKTSMLQDIEAGRKTEVEIFAGEVMELGRKYGIETPVNDMFFKFIRALEQM